MAIKTSALGLRPIGGLPPINKDSGIDRVGQIQSGIGDRLSALRRNVGRIYDGPARFTLSSQFHQFDFLVR